MRILSQNRIKFVAIIVANMLTLWFLTILNMNITNWPPNSLFYTEQLPIFYWVGIALGCIALGLLMSTPVGEKHKYVFEISLIIIFALYLFGTPTIVYENPRFLDTYGVIERIRETIQSGHILIYGGYDVEYPLSNILFIQNIFILKLSPLQFAKLFPLIHVLIISVILYTTSKIITSQYSVIPPLLYLSFSWLDSQHLCPQSYGLMITSVFVLLLIKRFVNKPDQTINLLLIFIIIIMMLSHPITPIINLIPLIIFCVLAWSLSVRKHTEVNVKQISGFLILYTVILFSYLFYSARGIFNIFISNIISYTEDFLYGGTIKIVGDFTTTYPMQSYVLNFQLRMLSVILFMILGLLSVLIIVYINKKDTSGLIVSSFFLGYSSLFIFIIISGNTDFFDRGYYFALLVMPLLIPIVLKILIKGRPRHFFKVVCVLILIINLFLFPIMSNGVDPYMVPSESELAVNRFVMENEELNSLINYTFYGSPAVYNTYWYNYLELKHNLGDEYRNQFNMDGLNKIYDSHQSCIYYPDNKLKLQELEIWKYTGYRGI